MNKSKKTYQKATRIIILSVLTAVLLVSGFYVYRLNTGKLSETNSKQNSTTTTQTNPGNAVSQDLANKVNSSTTPETVSINPPPISGQGSSSASPETQKQALALYDQGIKLYYQRSYNSALNLFNKALALDPNCYQAINGKGATYAFLGRYNEGISLVRQAIKLKPDYEYGYFNLGISNELAGNWNEAIAAYKTALTLNSKDAWAYYGIASIYGRQGNVAKVVEYLQQAIAADPGVKESAREEKDFNPVHNAPEFKALVQ